MRPRRANEETISRENKGESVLFLFLAPSGGKVLTGTGPIKTDAAGSFGKGFKLAAAALGLGQLPEEPTARSSGGGAYLRG